MQASREVLDTKLFNEYKLQKKEFVKFLNWKESVKLRDMVALQTGNNRTKMNKAYANGTKLVWKRKHRRNEYSSKTLKWTYKGLRWFKQDKVYCENIVYETSIQDQLNAMEKKLNEMTKRLDSSNKFCKCDVIDIKRLAKTRPVTVTNLIDPSKGKEKVDAVEKIKRKQVKRKELKKSSSEKNFRKETAIDKENIQVDFDLDELIEKKYVSTDKEIGLKKKEMKLKTTNESAKDSNEYKQVKKKVVYVKTEDMTEEMTKIINDENDIILIEDDLENRDEGCSSRNELVSGKSLEKKQKIDALTKRIFNKLDKEISQQKKKEGRIAKRKKIREEEAPD